MARRSQTLKLITLIALIFLIVILVMNIFNNGKSYHYSNVEEKQQLLRKHKFMEIWSNRTIVKNNTRTDLRLDYSVREPLTTELVLKIQKKIPGLPIEYFYRHSNQIMQKFKNCAQYPAIQVLNFYNTYWQSFYIDDSIYQLYGAYYDDRPHTGPVIRILAMSNYQQKKVPVIYCQLWFENDNRPVLATVKDYNLIWDTNWGVVPGVYYPYIMTCEIPKNINVTGDATPKVVNLVMRQCDTASNSLRITYEKPAARKKIHTFAVCVKGLDFPYKDLSARLVEWLELLNILGVHKVFMHRLQVHGNISKVLDYYEAKGLVEVQNITLVGGMVGQPELQHWLLKTYPLNKRLNEIIPYNDCFYRNMYKYDYIALLDIDEIIMPKDNLKTWQHLIAKAKSLEQSNNCPLGFPSLCATQVYYPSKLENQQIHTVNNNPSYMFMLNHVYRLNDYTTEHQHVKCLHSTQHVLALHNHYPLSYLERSCRPLDLPTSYAQLQHYRDIEIKKGQTPQIKIDDNLSRFRKSLIENCAKVLKDLRFLN